MYALECEGQAVPGGVGERGEAAGAPRWPHPSDIVEDASHHAAMDARGQSATRPDPIDI